MANKEDKTNWTFMEHLPAHADTLQHRAFHLHPNRHPDHATGEASWYVADDGRLMLCYGDSEGGYVWVIASDDPDAEVHFLDDIGTVQ